MSVSVLLRVCRAQIAYALTEIDTVEHEVRKLPKQHISRGDLSNKGLGGPTKHGVSNLIVVKCCF